MKFKHFLHTHKRLTAYILTVCVLGFAMFSLGLLTHHIFVTFGVLHPFKQANGKVVVPTTVVHDDSGKALSEAEPVPVRGTHDSTKPVVHVPVAAATNSGIAVPILMYHHVGPLPPDADGMRKDLTVSAGDFAAQVQWLASRGYTSVTLEQVYLATQKKFSLPPKPIVFTFDDGYGDVFVFAVPVLQKYGMVGSFAIVPGFLGTPDYGTWADVSTAKAVGMEIVSHTETHFDGSSSKFDSAYIQQNLEQSLASLENHIGPIPRILVYPYGHFTPEYIAVAERVGFTMALTTRFGMHVDPAGLMHTPRVRVHGAESLDKFIEILTGKKK